MEHVRQEIINKMSTTPKPSLVELFKGFSKLDLNDRLKTLAQAGLIDSQEAQYLRQGGMTDTKLGEKFIENVIGYFQLPLGVATQFRINGEDVFIPMAVEETSIVAAASKSAKWVRENGELTTSVVGQNIIGQIQFALIKNPENFKAEVLRQKAFLIEQANREVAAGLVSRGGGVSDIQVRFIDREEAATPEGYSNFMAVVHVLLDPVDAMGANIVNQVCEFLKEPLQRFTGETVTMCILSNLVDTKLTRAKIVLKSIDDELAYKIQEASLFAEKDPYRAATNNKGVLNGIDPILIATGNDWRAVEAGVHSFAARSGQYRSITRWRRTAPQEITGEFEAPLVVGTVGGVTALHPTAKIAMKIMGIRSAAHLSQICAAVGLTQNLGALKALTTVGIIEGHMKLHIKNLSLGAGAQDHEMPLLQKKLEEILQLRKRISLSNAIEALQELRATRS
jgi:hydroxymethylglutaryl-CoA reductase